MSKITGKVNYKEVLKGDTGYTFEPHVTVDGILYWTNNGDLPNPYPVNIKGKNGDMVQNDEINYIKQRLNDISLYEGTSNSDKLINMFKKSIERNIDIYIPNGEYYLNENFFEVVEPFSKINIIGENRDKVILHFNSDNFLRIANGSGKISGCKISNITFVGNNNNTAIILNNVCGYNIENCEFKNLSCGVKFINSDNGFTEYCIVDKCNFNSSCSTTIEYITIGSEKSFHGSGIKNTTINQGTKNSIIINENCLVYNAPLDFSIWCHNNKSIILNKGNINSNFYGNLKIESFTDNISICENKLYLCGNILSNSETVKINNLMLCDRIQMNSDGSMNYILKQRNLNKRINFQETDLFTIDDGESYFVDINLRADNYEYSYLLYINKYVGNDEGIVKVISENRNFNVASLGAPIFKFKNRGLQIINPNYINKNVEVNICLNMIGNRNIFFMR